jgi:activator of 2-hydroxyglutaryl-CoA dehydratase
MLADIGTTWAKIKDENENYHILPTKQILTEKWHFSRATGHLGKERCGLYLNELEALGYGAREMISEPDFTIVDVGSRDTKYLSFKNRKVSRLDWNQSCGSSTGFTLELLLKYYDLTPSQIPILASGYLPITCAVFGMEKIFDAVIQGEKVEEAIARFILGIAGNVYEFAQRPSKIYLSGGLCENEAFLNALQQLCEVQALGRYVLLEGLSAIAD